MQPIRYNDNKFYNLYTIFFLLFSSRSLLLTLLVFLFFFFLPFSFILFYFFCSLLLCPVRPQECICWEPAVERHSSSTLQLPDIYLEVYSGRSFIIFGLFCFVSVYLFTYLSCCQSSSC